MLIERIDAQEILDSRGYPTLCVEVALTGGIAAAASVPSGASTGQHEAVELRDGDPKRYQGKGVLRAAANVRTVIQKALLGFNAGDQAGIDQRMIELDGTPNKSKLGANAILGVSMAVARAAAAAENVQLYRFLGGPDARRMPVPMMNVINGGKHADNLLDFQEFMIVPHGAPSFAEALRYGAEAFHALALLLRKHGYATAVGDEGGFAPDIPSNEEACTLIVEAIRNAGFVPGEDIALAIDPAASSFFKSGQYLLEKSAKEIVARDELLAEYFKLARSFPLVSIEDGFAEEDWDGFQALTATLGETMQIVGDDLYVTNLEFIRRGIQERASNAVLIKLNQIGTVTETIAAVKLCLSANWQFVISHRSGETEDTFIADFAVAMGGGQIKAGAPSRGERLAKYNRLLQIDRDLGSDARYWSPFRKAFKP
jgi:enolase